MTSATDITSVHFVAGAEMGSLLLSWGGFLLVPTVPTQPLPPVTILSLLTAACSVQRHLHNLHPKKPSCSAHPFALPDCNAPLRFLVLAQLSIPFPFPFPFPLRAASATRKKEDPTAMRDGVLVGPALAASPLTINAKLPRLRGVQRSPSLFPLPAFREGRPRSFEDWLLTGPLYHTVLLLGAPFGSPLCITLLLQLASALHTSSPGAGPPGLLTQLEAAAPLPSPDSSVGEASFISFSISEAGV